MKTKTILFTFLFFPLFSWAHNPAEEAVENYVLKHQTEIYEKASFFSGSEELFLDRNLKCFSSYSYREEVGFCRVSGSTDSGYSTFLVVIKEGIPGDKDSPLVIDVVETSRIFLK